MPDVYVRLREGGLNDGEPIPANGTVTLTPVRVVDPEALVTNATTVLRVAAGEADPVSVSAGRWRVDARSRSWQKSWTVDLEDDAGPVNLALLVPVDPASPLPWMPTEADMAEVREARQELRDAIEGGAIGGPITVETDGDGGYTLVRGGAPVPVEVDDDGVYTIGA